MGRADTMRPLWMNKLKAHSIGTKMMYSFSLLFIVTILLIGTISYRMFSRTIEAQIVEDTRKLMDQTLINADFYFSDMKTPMIMIALNSHVHRILETYDTVEWQDRLEMKRVLEDFTRNINQFKSYIKDIILIGRNGFVYNINSVDEIARNYPFHEAPWMEPALSGTREGIRFISTHVSDYYTGAFSRDKVVSAMLPIVKGRTVLGYVLCDINVQKFGEIFKSLSLGSGGFVYMVDQEGHVIFHPDSDRIGTKIDEDLLASLSGGDAGYFRSMQPDGDKLIMYSQSKVTGWVLVGDIPYAAITSAANRNRTITYSILALSILLIVAIAMMISRQLTKPIKLLIDRMKKVQTHDLQSRNVDYGTGEIALIGERFESMLFEINKLIQEVYISKLRQREAEFKELQNRINPHFLYNTLQLVKAEAVLGRPHEVSSLVTTLGDLLRYPMYGKDEQVQLRQEIDYVAQYIHIYQRRFRGKFEYRCEADPEAMDVCVPKLTLQPIVENAIIHGFEDMKSGGLLEIVIQRSLQRIHVIVRDNGKGIEAVRLAQLNDKLRRIASDDGSAVVYGERYGRMPEEDRFLTDNAEQRSGIGVVNVAQRLRLKFGNKCTMSIRSKDGEFTEVWVSIPYIPAASNDAGHPDKGGNAAC